MRSLGLGACAALAAMLGGCNTLAKPHNDVLVFGTTTKVGIDVAAPVQSGALPEFTVGYKRNEGVWMPLKANSGPDNPVFASEPWKTALEKCIDDAEKAHNSKPAPAKGAKPPFDLDGERMACANEILPAVKYLASAEGVDSSKGGSRREEDTYSVFASFGGRGSLAIGSSSGALAQFFATGIAAQRLGANPYVIAALNADGETPVNSLANAEKAKAETEAEKERTEQAKIYAGAAIDELRTEIDSLESSWADCPADGDTERFNAVLANLPADGAPRYFLEGRTTRSDVIIELRDYGDARAVRAYHEARDKVCAS